MSGNRGNLAWVPLEEAHIVALFGRTCPYTLKGIAFYWCDKLAGIGGVALQGDQWVAFSDLDETAKVPDIAVWRSAHLVMKEVVGKMKVPVYARVAEPSHKWARLLGFEQCDEELFVWPIRSVGQQ